MFKMSISKYTPDTTATETHIQIWNVSLVLCDTVFIIQGMHCSCFDIGNVELPYLCSCCVVVNVF